MTVEGIDNSVFNTADPNPASLGFIISRATYGTSPDRRFAQHESFARRAGLVSGAYHFGTNNNVGLQVNAFLATAGSTPLLALDLEGNGAATMSNDEAATFIRLVHAKGRKIGLYHSLSGYPHLGQDWDWIARWGDAPPPGTWQFWQYRGAPLDRDRFNGSVAQLRVLAGLAPTPKYAVSVHPVAGSQGYPAQRYFNVFNVSGTAITHVGVARTGGFSATCTPPRRFTWAGHADQHLVQLTSGSRRGFWIRAAHSHGVTA